MHQMPVELQSEPGHCNLNCELNLLQEARQWLCLPHIRCMHGHTSRDVLSLSRHAFCKHAIRAH